MARQRNSRSYEGRQYRGGRRAKTPNLKRTPSGDYVNKKGVVITQDERKRMESLVNSANRKRAKMLKEAATLPRKVAGVDTGDTIGNLQLMGKESDFILARRSKSLQRFETRKQFDQYLDSLERVNSKDYITDRIRAYKRNFTETLTNVYGDEAKDIVMKIRMMKPEEYMKKVESDERLEIGAVIPSDAKVAGRLNEVRRALGMKEKPEWVDEEFDV